MDAAHAWSDTAPVARLKQTCMIVGLVALAASVVGIFFSAELFFRAYLWAFCYVLAIPLGCLVILMIQYLTGGTWGYVLRPQLEAATRTIPLVALFFVPLGIGIATRHLYEWAQPESVIKLDANLEHKSLYLNIPFALIRAAIYFAVWTGLMAMLDYWSRHEAEPSNPARAHRIRVWSALGIVAYAMTMTFASIDWLMSLEPKWYSTMYPPLFGFGQILTGFAFAVASLMLLSGQKPLAAVLARVTLADLGKLMLAFVMIWSYLAFSQFLLIWSGNLPEETPWYLKRIAGGWLIVALSLVLLHFAMPFLLLLSRDLKRDSRGLVAVAILILVMRAVDLFWNIMPAFKATPASESSVTEWLGAFALDLATIVGLGSIWLCYFLTQVSSRKLLPTYEPQTELAPHG